MSNNAPTKFPPVPTINPSHSLKLLAIIGIALLLLIPSMWMSSLVSEREGYRDQAAREVHAMWGGPQVVGSPVLTLPYSYNCPQKLADGTLQEAVCSNFLRLYPQKLSARGDFPTSERKRGIYPIALYQADLEMNFHFAEPDWNQLGVDPERVAWDRSHISLHLEDPRGIKTSPTLAAGTQSWQLSNNTLRGAATGSLATAFPAARVFLEKRSPLTLKFRINGSGSFLLEPLAQEVEISLRSDWPHPSFTGMFLPEERTVSPQGFQARWSLTALNHTTPMAWTATQGDRRSGEVSVGFRQATPVDHYSMTDRAVKYVILFIALTFVLCHFAERLTGVEIHPLQYILIGTALLLFYALLLSLSESIGFGYAYAVSTIAISAQIALFVRALLRHRMATIFAPTVLGMLYGFLFVLLRLEDLSLLAGSLGLFLILGALMYISVRFQNKFSKAVPCPTESSL